MRGKGWLKPALVDAGVPEPLQSDCVRYLIDAFHAMLREIASTDPSHLLIVDSRGTLAERDWAERIASEGSEIQEDRQGALETRAGIGEFGLTPKIGPKEDENEDRTNRVHLLYPIRSIS